MKSKKTIESFVGKIIYGFLLFMPILSILTRSLYVVLNDNAFESYAANETLDNVFEYAISQVQTNSLYNWATTTGTYTIINQTTTTLGITNTFVDLLLTYWFLITIIYILFDIAFVMLMYVHDKIHGLLEK